MKVVGKPEQHIIYERKLAEYFDLLDLHVTVSCPYFLGELFRGYD